MKKKNSIFKNFGFWLVALFTFYITITVLVFPYIAQNQISGYLNDTLKNKASLERVRFNPFGFELRLYNFKLYDKNNDILTDFEDIRVDFNLIKSLYTQEAHFDALTVEKSTINIKLLKDGKINFLELIPKENKSSEETPKKEEQNTNNKLFPVNLDKITLEKIEVLYTDFTIEEPLKISIYPLRLSINNLSTKLERKGSYDFGMTLNKHTQFNTNGTVTLNPIRVVGDVTLKELHTADYWPLLKKDLDFDISDILVNFDSNYKVSYINDKLTLNLLKTKTNIDNITVTESSKNIIALKKLYASLESLELIKGNKLQMKLLEVKTNLNDIKYKQNDSNHNAIALKEISNNVASIELHQDDKLDVKVLNTTTNLKDISYRQNNSIENIISLKEISNDVSSINLHKGEKLELTVSDIKTKLDNFFIKPTKSKNNVIALKEIKTDVSSFDLDKQQIQINSVLLTNLYTDFVLNKDKSNNIEPLFASKKKTTKKETSKKESKEWNVTIKNADLKKSKVLVTDNTIKEPFSTSLNNINLNMKDFSLKQNSKFRYKLATNIDKSSKLNAKGKLSIKPLSVSSNYDLSKLPLNMFQPYLNDFLNIDIKSADFNTKGKFDLSPKTNKISLSTNSNIKNIDIKPKGSKESLVSVSAININELKFLQEKNSLTITSVNLIEPYAKIHIDKDKNTNFDNIIKEKEENELAEAIEEKQNDNKNVRKDDDYIFDLGPIDFVKGSMDFTDLSLPLPFKSFIESLNGSVSELSSHSSKPSKIKLRGVVDKYGEAKIDGELDHKNIKQNTNVNMLLKNISTKNLTPYSSEFIGRKINGGKLTLDLQYNIVESKLDATNNIIIHKIKLGEELKGENSMSLPLDLAIALLEDSNGVIDLSLPIDGDVDDPKFHIGDVIGDALSNMITGIVTAPFRFLGSLLGIEGDELEFIEFDYGSNTLLPPAIEKLDLLVKAYKTRPQLALEITKTYHTIKDSYVIKSAKSSIILDTQVKELNKKHKDKDTYLMALEDMYLKSNTKEKLEEFKKSFIVKKEKKEHFEQTKYINSLKEFHINSQVATKEDLENLATGRVNNIVDYLVEKHNAPQDRIIVKDFVAIEDAEDKNKWIKIELGVAVKQK